MVGTVEELPAYRRDHWPSIREELLMGRYQPSVIKRVALDEGTVTVDLPQETA